MTPNKEDYLKEIGKLGGGLSARRYGFGGKRVFRGKAEGIGYL